MQKSRNARRYVLLGAIFILAVFTLYFQEVSVQSKRDLLAAKMQSLEYDVEHVCNLVDHLIEQDGDWEADKHRGTFIVLTESIDSMPEIYAELMDSQFNTISQRIIPETDNWWFEPRDHSDLMCQLRSENEGYYTVVHKTPGHRSIEVVLRWRWIPTDDRYDNRILLLVGVSMYSVNTDAMRLMVFGIVLLIVISAAFAVIHLMLLTTRENNKEENV